jgi:hypothetical protein
VRHDVVMRHGRSRVPDAIPSQNADLAIASGRIVISTIRGRSHKRETSGAEKSGARQVDPGPLGIPMKSVHGKKNIKPTDIQNIRLRFRQAVKVRSEIGKVCRAR